MKRTAATIMSRLRSAGRWYLESWAHLDPAVALGTVGTGLVAVPASLQSRRDDVVTSQTGG